MYRIRGSDLLTWTSRDDDVKIEALRQHASQLGDWDPEEPLKTWAETVGKKVGFKYAEGFRLLTLKVDEGDEEKEDEEEAAE
jgi:hypothetical protein